VKIYAKKAEPRSSVVRMLLLAALPVLIIGGLVENGAISTTSFLERAVAS